MSLAEVQERSREETKTAFKMCTLIKLNVEPSKLTRAGAIKEHPGCKVLGASLLSAKSTLPKGTYRRVFIQDLAAALSRRTLLTTQKYDAFVKHGYKYMEA